MPGVFDSVSCVMDSYRGCLSFLNYIKCSLVGGVVTNPGLSPAAVEVEGAKVLLSPSLMAGGPVETFGGLVESGLELATTSPPRFPGSLEQVENGLRVDFSALLPDPPFWTPEEESVLRAAGIYSPFPFSAAEYYPVLGSCDRCTNRYFHQYSLMLQSGVPQVCPCGIPLPHEAVLSVRFQECSGED